MSCFACTGQGAVGGDDAVGDERRHGDQDDSDSPASHAHPRWLIRRRRIQPRARRRNGLQQEDLVAEVIDNTTSRGRTIRFLWDGSEEEFRAVLERLGETPLPKYIKRKPDQEADAPRQRLGHRLAFPDDLILNITREAR